MGKNQSSIKLGQLVTFEDEVYVHVGLGFYRKMLITAYESRILLGTKRPLMFINSDKVIIPLPEYVIKTKRIG